MTRTRLLIVSLLTLLGAAIAVPSINAAPTCTISFTGAVSNAWSNPGNWNHNRLPGGGDDVCIDDAAAGTVVFTGLNASVKSIQGAQTLRIESGTLTVLDDPSADTTIGALHQTGGTIDGAGTLFVAGDYSWSGGSLGGSNGLIAVKGQTHISGNVTMQFDRELSTHGGTWTAGQIYARNRVAIRNTGTFTVSNESETMQYHHWDGTPPTFINEGTLVKSAGAATSTIGWRIENDGLVNATSGTLSFTGGSAGSTGQFQSPGGELKWAGGTFLMTAGGYDGVELTGGRIEVPADATYSGGDLAISAGSVGGTGTLETTGTFTWTGGSLEDTTGLLRSTGFTRIDGNVAMPFHHRLETADGEWISGQIYSRNNTLWTNKGTFEMRSQSGEAVSSHWSGGPPTIKNLGTITRTSGAATTTVQWAIENDGVVRTDEGRLAFTGGGGVSNGNFASEDTGRTVLAGGTFRVGDSSTPYDGFEISGGRVDVEAGQTFSGLDLWQSGGVIGGTGTLATSGTFTWTGGDMDDTGLTRSTGFTRIDGNVSMAFNHKLQTHHGEWVSGQIYSRNNTLWTNTGTFDMRSETGDAIYNHWSGAAPKIVNTGTIVKTSTAGSDTTDNTIVGWALENDGIVRTDAGRLVFNGGGGESNGNFASEETGRTVLGAGHFFLGESTAPYDGFEVAGSAEVDVVAGASFTGADLWQSGGTIGGPGTLATTGTFVWTGGNQNEGGLTKSTGFTRIDGNVAFDFDRNLQTHDGEWLSGQIYSRNNTTWTNTGNFELRAEGAIADYHHWSGAQPRIVNTGTFTKTAGTGNTDLEFDLTNDGTIRTETGRIRFTDGGDQGESNGSFASEGDGRTTLQAGTFLVGTGTFDGFEVAGNARVDLASGATYAGVDLWQSGGVIGGPGTITSSGTFTWTGGSMDGAGATRSSGFTRIDGNVSIEFDRTLETKDGEWLTGTIASRNNTLWRNTGAFAMRSTGDIVHNNWSGGPPRLHNTGQITRPAPAPDAVAEDLNIGFPVDNDGSMTSSWGTIRLNGGGDGVSTGSFGAARLGGNWTFGTGATFVSGGEFAGGTLTLQDGVDIDLPGGRISSGTITGNGDIRVPSGELVWAGGDIRGTGLLHVAKGAKLTLGGDHFRNLSGRRLLQNEGTLRWENGYVQVRDAATLLNEGTLEAVAESGRHMQATSPTQEGRPSFVNTGTILKSAGTGTASLPGLENQGLIDVRSGALESSGFRQTASGRILATIAEAGHGRFIASSEVRLAGRVAVRLADGFTPAHGATYPVVSTSWSQPENGALTPETLSFGDGGTLTGALANNQYVFTASVPQPAPPRAVPEPVEASPAPAPAADAEAEAAATDSVVRLAPGGEATVAVPEGATVELITQTKRAKVRFDRKARKLRVKLRRGARGNRLKLRYRIVAADGTRSKITTLTVRISRSAPTRR